MIDERDYFSSQQLSQVMNHLRRLNYQFRDFDDDPFGFFAIPVGEYPSVNILGRVRGPFVLFCSAWTRTDYAIQNYNSYLIWVNSLNLNSLAVQFCINSAGSLEMQLCYFGMYDSDAFNLFYDTWKGDIRKVYLSDECERFLG